MEHGAWLDMKLLVGKLIKILNKKRGELLMEAIISVMLLSILLVIVATMIQTSRNMTANSMRDASALQEGELNLLALGTDTRIESGSVISFEIQDLDIYSEHEIRLFEENGINIAFFPD
jgi:competence protein ComGC